MQVTINIPDQLAAEAAARGVALNTYVEAVLARQVAPLVEEYAHNSAVEEMQKFAKKHGATLGDLNLKDLTHEGHLY